MTSSWFVAAPSPAWSPVAAACRVITCFGRATVQLGQVEAVEEFGGVTFRPLRRLLGIEAFGVAAWVAGPGERLVVDHAEEGEDGQEELYL